MCVRNIRAQWNAWQNLARQERERLGSVEAALRRHSTIMDIPPAEMHQQQEEEDPAQQHTQQQPPPHAEASDASDWIEAVDPETGSVYE